MQSLDDTLQKVKKKFGDDVIAGEQNSAVEFISSGSIKLDIALGGGFAKGRIISLKGWESSGKSTIALHLVAEIQKLGGKVLYIDSEYALDPLYATNLGIDMDMEKKNRSFYLAQPTNAEEGFEIAKEFVKVEEVKLIVFDSVDAMRTKVELEGDAGEAKMGVKARLMSQEIPKLVKLAKENGTIILFINQLREKIGVMFGNPETTSGGNALKFYATQILDIKASTKNKDKDTDEIESRLTRVSVEKNKVAPPFRKALLTLKFGVGIDKIQEVLDLAVEFEIIKKSGSWFSYEDVKIGQGETKAYKMLEDNLELYEEVKQKILTKLNSEK